MKKHFLRVLTVMLMVCLGIGVLAACGDGKETPEEPPATETIEGVWTDGTGEMANSTVTLDVDGNTLHVVVKTSDGYSYNAFTKAADGSFTYSPSAAMGTITLSLNAENKLEYKYTPGTEGGKAETFTYETKAALPAALDITGTKYTTYNGTEATITFGATPAITYDGEPLDNVKAVDVGGFKVFSASMEDADVTAIVYKDGNTNKAYVSLDGENPGAGETCILSDTAPTPAPADPMDGVWTGGTATGSMYTYTLTATVKIVGNKAYAVIMEQHSEGQNQYTHYRVKILEKQGDGSYKLIEGTDVYTGTLNAQNQLVVTMPGSMVGQSGTATVTFTDQADLPAPIAPSGTLYPNQAGNSLEINFTTKELKQGTQSVPNAQFVNVGNYIVISVSIPNMGSADFIVYENNGTYYWVAGASTAELVGTKPTPAPATYAVEFSLGQNSENHSTGDYTLPTRAEDKAVGDKIDLPATDPTPASGWKFDGWYTENDQPAKGADGKYTVAAADDENNDGKITLTAKWALHWEIGNDVYEKGGTWNEFIHEAHEPVWHDTIAPGQKVTVTGIVKYEYLAAQPYRGAVAHLYDGNQTNADAGVCINHLNGGSNNAMWAVYGSDAVIVGATDPNPETWYAEVLAATGTSAGGKLTIVWEYSYNSAIFCTITYATNDGTKSVTRSYVYRQNPDQTITAKTYNIGVDIDQGYVVVTGVEKVDGTAKSAEVVIGVPNNQTSYYAEYYGVGTIQQGDTLTVTGTQTSLATANFHAVGVAVTGSFFRADNYVNMDGMPVEPDEGFVLGDWKITKQCSAEGNGTTDFWEFAKSVFADCSFELKIEWVDSTITISYTFTKTGDETKKFKQTFTIVADSDKSLAENYSLALGCDHCFAAVSNIAISHSAPAAE